MPGVRLCRPAIALAGCFPIYGAPASSPTSVVKPGDGSAVISEDKRWEFAVIGRNLTNKRNLINGIDRTGTGSGKGSALPSCTAAGQTGCAALSDIIGTPTLPRTVALQATFRY